ncbi:hypothetical protein BDR03DRAFT_1017934 [Suillus americanus]|nr:hypothetical protein BDR03DRAFT_1017934 [Suillus americanus]
MSRNAGNSSLCTKFIENFRKGVISKGDALLEIQRVLLDAISKSETLSPQDFKPSFNHFFELLDYTSKESNPHRDSSRVTNDPPRSQSAQPERERVPKKEDESDDSGEEHEYVLRGKRRKLTAEPAEFYPWLDPDKFRFVSSQRAEELTLKCYEEWSEDTQYY